MDYILKTNNDLKYIIKKYGAKGLSEVVSNDLIYRYKDDYYFLLSLSRSKKELESSSLVEEYFNFLQKYNLLQKTFVFCEEKYSKYFDKVILINRINYSEEENIEKWRKDFLRNIDDVTSLFKQQNY